MGVTFTFILIYLLGGLTFLPILLILILVHAYFTFPEYPPSPISLEHGSVGLQVPTDDERALKSGSSAANLAEKFQRRHEADVAAGYFAVCREYVPGGINGKPPERTTPAGTVVATESLSVYQSMYRSIFDRKQGPTIDPGKGNGKAVRRARNVFFVVLRHGHLMLYEDAEQLEVKHVISLELHDVNIYGGDDVNPIPEGELWIKRNAIRLERKTGLDDLVSTSKPFYLFSENCSEKEDFYFALLQNQEIKPDAPSNPPRPQQYEIRHIVGLVQQLHSSEEHLQTRWINALVGRLFLALYKTQDSENFVRRKITKKIARVKKPAFLSDIVLHKVDLGESAPHIINPRLKDLTVDGDCCVEADVKYSGKFRLEIAATAKIDLGARFKAREVNLVLAVVIKKLNGHGLLKFKPPPSNRVWISFETMPDMDMTIEPIVSSRQITYGFILRTIESRIREVMAETVVLPHWDDSPFTDTTHQQYRGGIWVNQSAEDPSIVKETKIPDEAPQDEMEVGVDAATVPQLPPRRKEGKSVSIPDLLDSLSVDSHHKLDSAVMPSTAVLIDSAKDGAYDSAANDIQKTSEPPKALRSRSFASAANPLLNTDNANFNATTSERHRKQNQDATSAMMAISSRSRPTSPNDESDVRDSEAHATLWENSQKSGTNSSTTSDSKVQLDQRTNRRKSTDSSVQLSRPSTPTSTNSHSAKSTLHSESSKPRALQADGRSSTASEKRQAIAALGAATVAAKTWGWGMLNRNGNQKNQRGIGQDRTGSPKQPIGRGQPLPPPGQPLPFPGGVRSKTAPTASPKRKPVPNPSLPQRRQEETKPRPDAPPLPARRRQSSAFVDEGIDEGLLVVEAPPESEPSSPTEEHPPDSGVTTKDEQQEEQASSVAEGYVWDKESPDTGDSESRAFRSSFDEDEHALTSWQSAQEAESRSKNIWLEPEEHS
ncbi:hypothetical protein MMC21_002281 [Puttea exsequens]|nr:hypothetical protein [Puttea exsequens]